MNMTNTQQVSGLDARMNFELVCRGWGWGWGWGQDQDRWEWESRAVGEQRNDMETQEIRVAARIWIMIWKTLFLS